MRTLIITIALLCFCATNANAVEWVDASPKTVAVYGPSKTTAEALGGYYYRIKTSGRILRKPAGTTHYSFVTIDKIPRAYRAAVIEMYEQYIGTDEEPVSSSTSPGTRTRTRTRTTDSRRYDTHDRSDRSDRRRYDQHDASTFRDRDVRYRVHTEGNLAPVLIAHDNYLSTVEVHVHPASQTTALAIFGENRRLTQQVIAANRSESQAQADLRVERAKPPIVRIVRAKPHCPPVCLEAKNWVCGRQFKDQFNRTWNLLSGPRMSHKPCKVRGCLGQLADGRLTLTVRWCGKTTVYVDP